MNLFQLLCFSWGFKTHCIIGKLVMRMTRTNLDLCKLSVLPDILKFTKNYTWTRTLHYTDTKDSQPSECVVRNTKGLIDSIKGGVVFENKTIELAMKIHFIQDAHQPLHLSSFKRGGNDYFVNWNNRKVSLHRIWDIEIINKRLQDFHSETQFIDYLETKNPKLFTFESINKLNCLYVLRIPGQYSDLSLGYYNNTILLVEDLLVSAALQVKKALVNFYFQKSR